MADRRGVIVPLLILAFIFLSPDPGRAPQTRFDDRPRPEDIIVQEQRSLSVLQNASYGDLVGSDGRLRQVLNLTGLEPDRDYAWEAIPKLRGRAQEQLAYALGVWGKEALGGTTSQPSPTPLYNNVTGFVRGKWVRSRIQESIQVPQLNLSRYAQDGPFGPIILDAFDRNITGAGGDMRIRFHERMLEDAPFQQSNLTKMGAEITFVDQGVNEEEYELQAYGVYDTHLGQAILTTTSDKFAGIFLSPHLALSENTYESHKTFLNASLSKTIQRQIDGEIVTSNAWSTKSENTPRTPFDHPECELIIWLQQLAPVTSTAAYASPALAFLERELRFPTGAIMPQAPEIRFSMLAFSPDCGYVLESQGPPDHLPQEGDHLKGPKIESLYQKGRHHLLLFSIVVMLQTILLMRQMREANTPSTRSKISFYTIAMMALGDGFATMTFLLISLFIAGLWVNLISLAFLSFTSVSFFGMRFLLDIWNVGAPERMRQARAEAEEERERRERFAVALEQVRTERRTLIASLTAQQAGGPPPAGGPPSTTNGPPPASATAPTSEPPPTTNQPPAETPVSNPAANATDSVNVTPAPPTALEQAPPGSLPQLAITQPPANPLENPVFMPSDQAGLELAQPFAAPGTITVEPRPTSFGSIYTRFYLLLLLTLFLSLNAASWPAILRRFYFTTLSLIYLSFWVPQIFRNIQRNCRHPLNWEYILGESVLRLVPFAYFYGYRHNVLLTDPDYYSLTLLTLWLWIQVVILGSQELIGPRWFIRRDWAPPAYDYHPVLREDEEGATMPLGISQAADAVSSAPASPSIERRASLSTRRGSVAKKDTSGKGRRVFDCAICFQDLEVPVIEADGGTGDATSLGGGLLARRNYMVTPCRHIFHSACLEGWMKYRLQCPICRETLPPL